MTNKEKLLAVLLVLLVSLMTSVCEGQCSSKAKVIRLAHNSQANENDVLHYTALRFKELVEEKSSGKLTVQIFPNGQYGGEREIFEACTFGTTDMTFSSNANIGSFVPAAIAVDLPFMFSNDKAVDAALDGPAGQAILDAMNSVGVQGLAYGEIGFRHFVTNKKGIYNINDLAGMKIRVIENEMVVSAYKALGANPVPMAWAESLTGMQQGTVGGMDIPISMIYGFKFQDLAKYTSLVGMFYNAGVFTINQAFYKGLTQEQRAIIKEAAREAAKKGREFNRTKESKWLESLREAGMKIITPEEIDLNSFRSDGIEKIYNDYAAKIGGTYVQDLREAANAAGKNGK